MKKTDLMTMTAAMMFAASGYVNADTPANTDKPVIGKQEIRIKNKKLTPEALWAMGRIGSSSISPDGKQIAYTVSYYSVKENKSHTVIYVMNADGTNNLLLTHTADSEVEPTWIKGGSKIAFLTAASGSMQIWEMNPDGSERKQLSSYEGGIEGFKFSPDESKVLFISQVKYGQRTSDIYPDLDKASGKVINDLMYKHWDEWVENIPHPFVASFDGNQVGAVTDILKDEPYESPMKPFGGIEQLAWSNDSKQIAYTCRKKTGLEYSVSTDSDIYLYNTETGETRNLCKEDATDKNLGYDTNPKFSPDGKSIAWQSMERDGYESDRNRLCVMDLKSGEKTYVTEAFQSGVDDYCWAPDGKTLYFVGVWHATSMVHSTNLKGEVKQLTDGMYDYTSVAMLNNKQLLTKRHSLSEADELFTVDLKKKNAVTRITKENDQIFSQLQMGKVEARWTKTVDGKDMLSWVVYPANFNPNKKYPTLLFCQGGPQSPVSQFWSYRWNLQLMAANDYIIIAPNRRGLPGFGMEWLEDISTNYGGHCMDDYLSAIDDIAKEPYVDKDRLGCVGASFGGYSVYWLAGHHNKRFKAFIAHDGFFNMEQQYLETEELWFTNWDLGGAYWEKNNPAVQRSYANSPHLFVDKWDTPILCIHGEKDFRILASQGMAAFNAAKLRGVPAQLLIFPDENHWVLKPQNGILWQRTFFAWLDKWLKPENK
ncbi:alpha/beta hydrolase family protein [Phocaeicola coprocola]|uniref:S9 family peptidase n=1 Tax=Phocaeicola coprocola TaxID=310298 RepID=UPI001C394259|nr:S9 family peptidase [Phocaeicola coprocola]MBV3866563.1 S9 family peptidase [Phocaeicola coprocola]MBV4007813.1 S9 family peptidase [Phocaeicola coprocola]MBV4032240.1 S9 family peptidase [Phocaeicola coprocola]MBV4038793.1 S9 family peptidase [Phocaeicola coprocola]MBV4060398.1 S9 family peptidase [Phocaeicola coprocola]